ncbi:MAG TPA: hypothetical protein PKW80_01765 [Bacteroidales bacterium]|nr:hypothetical protein [Bacteroidales bacterium]
MKTKNVILKSIFAFAMLMWAVSAVFAQTMHTEKKPLLIPMSKNMVTCPDSICCASSGPRKVVTDLDYALRTKVTYPEFAEENQLSGFVVLAFRIDECGKIVIMELNSSSVDFQVYVEEKLGEMLVKDPCLYKGKTYYYRFDFVPFVG